MEFLKKKKNPRERGKKIHHRVQIRGGASKKKSWLQERCKLYSILDRKVARVSRSTALTTPITGEEDSRLHCSDETKHQRKLPRVFFFHSSVLSDARKLRRRALTRTRKEWNVNETKICSYARNHWDFSKRFFPKKQTGKNA